MAKGQTLQNTLVVANLVGIDKALKAVKHLKNGQRDALMGGINDTLKTAKTYTSKLIRDKVNIKKKDIDPHITTSWAKKDKLSGALFIKESERIPLKYFGARETAKGVTYKIDRQGSRKMLASGFIVESMGGHVFIRRGKKRFPLRKPKGVSAWGTFVKNDYIQPTQRLIYSKLAHNIDRRVRMLLLRSEGKI